MLKKMCAVQKHLKQPISRIVDGLRPPKNEAAGKQLAAGIAATAMAVRLLPEVSSISDMATANAAVGAVEHGLKPFRRTQVHV
jgi:hypothetical protein